MVGLFFIVTIDGTQLFKSGIITYTYIIGHYNRLVRITASHVVGVNFKHKWWDPQLKADSEGQIF